mmetsp:Transcript_100946/g.301162  ORF Transcript_100946/g.301162 Transcript_100946/m.301162 type:complete len:256 (+) Transcript_100946:335-1102(+)
MGSCGHGVDRRGAGLLSAVWGLRRNERQLLSHRPHQAPERHGALGVCPLLRPGLRIHRRPAALHDSAVPELVPVGAARLPARSEVPVDRRRGRPLRPLRSPRSPVLRCARLLGEGSVARHRLPHLHHGGRRRLLAPHARARPQEQRARRGGGRVGCPLALGLTWCSSRRLLRLSARPRRPAGDGMPGDGRGQSAQEDRGLGRRRQVDARLLDEPRPLEADRPLRHGVPGAGQDGRSGGGPAARGPRAQRRVRLRR